MRGVVQEVYWLGPAPSEEDCVQLGSPDYAREARAECKRYIKAIRHVCGPEPAGAQLTIKSLPHDFGSYFEVAVVFDPENESASEYAAKCDQDAPKTWGEVSIAEGRKLAFQPGTVVVTMGARQIATDEQLANLVRRHLSGDWGEVDWEDAKANDDAVKWSERILSSYRVNGEKLWVLTEADRSATTVMTPDEY
jgi:hypothetical protein